MSLLSLHLLWFRRTIYQGVLQLNPMALRKYNKKTIGSESKRKSVKSNAADGIAMNIGGISFLTSWKFIFNVENVSLGMFVFIWFNNNNNNNSNNNNSNKHQELIENSIQRREERGDPGWELAKKFLRLKWNDDEPDQQGCFVWITSWKDAPTHTIAAMMEPYENLILTKLRTSFETRTPLDDDVKWRLCRRTPKALHLCWLPCAGGKQVPFKVQCCRSRCLETSDWQSQYPRGICLRIQSLWRMYQYLLNTSTCRRTEWTQDSLIKGRRRALR